MGLKQRIFVLYVATNMLVCAVVFVPWALPRETISGLLGRWQLTERGWKRMAGLLFGGLVDRIYWWEPLHCVEVYVLEHEARQTLYP